MEMEIELCFESQMDRLERYMRFLVGCVDGERGCGRVLGVRVRW